MFSTLGGTVGISMVDTNFSSELVKHLAKVSGFTSSSSSGATSYTGLTQIQPESLRKQVLRHATLVVLRRYILFVSLKLRWPSCGYARTPNFSLVYIFTLSVCFSTHLTACEYSLQRNLQHRAKDAHKDGKAIADPADETPTPTARMSLSEEE